MTAPDPFGLSARAPEFSWELAQDTSTKVYSYRMTMRRGGEVEYESPWESLPTQDERVAREMARERTMMVAAMIVGARVESLTPRGIGDDGRPTTA